MVVDGETGATDETREGVVGVKGREVHGGELHGEGPVAFALFEAEPFVFFELVEIVFCAFIFEGAVCDGVDGEGREGSISED